MQLDRPNRLVRAVAHDPDEHQLCHEEHEPEGDCELRDGSAMGNDLPDAAVDDIPRLKKHRSVFQIRLDEYRSHDIQMRRTRPSRFADPYARLRRMIVANRIKFSTQFA